MDGRVDGNASNREKRAFFAAYEGDGARVESELRRMAEATSSLTERLNRGMSAPAADESATDESAADAGAVDEAPPAKEARPAEIAFSSELLDVNPTDFESRREFYVRAYDSPDKVIADLHYIARRARDLTERVDQGQHDRSLHDHDYVTLDVPAWQRGKIFAPVSGEVVPLWEVDEPGLADGSCGDGLAILPTSGTAVAPATCRITAQLPSRNAVGLLTQDGIELLLTVGSGAERHEGGGFRQHAWQNDTVRLGTPLISWDRRRVGRTGGADVVLLVVTNTEELAEVRVLRWGKVKAGDLVATVEW